MKRLFLLGAVGLLSLAANAQEFNTGDLTASVTLGVGAQDDSASHALFDQHLSLECGVKTFGQFTIGVGLAINNAYGAVHDGFAMGTYDYTYTKTVTTRTKNDHNRWVTSTESTIESRDGYGGADCKVATDHYNLMVMASLHYSPMSRLDTYVRCGLGIGGMSSMLSDFKNEEGFSERNYEHTSSGSSRETTTKFSYRDLDHVKWEGYSTKVTPAFALYLGATYYLTQHWGVDAQFGIISSNFAMGGNYSDSFSILAVGATYRF